MKYTLAIATALMLLLLATPPVFAQGAGVEWDTLNQEVMELYRTGNMTVPSLSPRRPSK